MNRKIVLASSSRYRAELLGRLGFPFETHKPDTDETPLPGEAPAETALRLSVEKALHVARFHPGALVIGADQVADLDGEQIGKPGTAERSRAQLRRMSGKTLVFHSGLALVDAASGAVQSRVVPTSVRFRALEDREIDNYLARENALDCAGSAKSEGLGVALVASMSSDDPTALIGLSLIAVTDMLANQGLKVLA